MAVRVSGALPRGLRYEPTPKRVRAELSGETLAASSRAILVWEPRRAVPVYAFPDGDVQDGFLYPSEHPVAEAHGGDAQFYTAVAKGRRELNAAWRYADPDLAGYLAFSWESMDRWYEEDEEVIGHPRDPFHRVDVRRGTEHVRVELNGEPLADTQQPVLVFETGLPTRFYLPPEDVRMGLLERTDTETICAYKGRARYFSVTVNGRTEPDLAWCYPDPLPDSSPELRGKIAFLAERLDIIVDGETLARPRTQWSSGVRPAPRGGGSGAHQGPHDIDDQAG